MANIEIIQGDCLDVICGMDSDSFDTIITDPPYGLSFMGKKWDYDVPSVEIWRECLRVLKPGGTALIFAGSRTQHRMAVNVEDAGFELFDTVLWLYGQGFPKSTNIKKQLTKQCKCGNMVAYEEAKPNTRTNEKPAGRTAEEKHSTQYNLRLVQETDIPETVNIKNQQGEVLFEGLQEQDLSVQQPKPAENVRQGQPRLEGWCYIETNARELSRCKVCSLSEGFYVDGSERWVCNGTPFGYGTGHWQATPADRSCPSYRPQPEQQQAGEPCAFCQQHSPQEIRAWNGWGTHLKPAFEPIICARKPNDGTYANNALKWGVSGLNIDGGRIGTDELTPRNNRKRNEINIYGGGKGIPQCDLEPNPLGRFPANIILDEEAGRMLDEQSGVLKSGEINPSKHVHKGGSGNSLIGSIDGSLNNYLPHQIYKSDSGGASRFFYCAKASKAERNAGCDGLEEKQRDFAKMGTQTEDGIRARGRNPENQNKPERNHHPTVKPLALMEYLCKLTKTPTGGTVLDPFMGSGTTGIACVNTGRDFVGIEREPDFHKIAESRINHQEEKDKVGLFNGLET